MSLSENSQTLEWLKQWRREQNPLLKIKFDQKFYLEDPTGQNQNMTRHHDEQIDSGKRRFLSNAVIFSILIELLFRKLDNAFVGRSPAKQKMQKREAIKNFFQF